MLPMLFVAVVALCCDLATAFSTQGVKTTSRYTMSEGTPGPQSGMFKNLRGKMSKADKIPGFYKMAEGVPVRGGGGDRGDRGSGGDRGDRGSRWDRGGYGDRGDTGQQGGQEGGQGGLGGVPGPPTLHPYPLYHINLRCPS
ncbi:hypothetical protein B484DRAFT_156798 [Ochromonadaceae sp. CCMP2298]|nr:hypothetical protein B484DRAFT_156798 [Ochromonadaceae sp. CCMP2298]